MTRLRRAANLFAAVALAGCGDGESAGVSPAIGDARAPEQPIWNGKDLTDWNGNPAVWRVVGDHIEAYAASGTVTQNTFLIYTGSNPADFVVSADIYVESGGNSGIQYRSTVLNPAQWVVGGYQADAGGTYWGLLYEERGRGTLANPSPQCKQSVKPNDFNAYEITARGPSLVQVLNGVPCVKYTETAMGKPKSGVIALQYHMPGGFHVSFKNIRLREL